MQPWRREDCVSNHRVSKSTPIRNLHPTTTPDSSLNLTFHFNVVSSERVGLKAEWQGGVGLVQEQVDSRKLNPLTLKNRAQDLSAYTDGRKRPKLATIVSRNNIFKTLGRCRIAPHCICPNIDMVTEIDRLIMIKWGENNVFSTCSRTKG